VSDLVRDLPEPDTLLARRLALVTDAKQAEVIDRLLAAVRSKILRERYKFDLDYMLHLMVDEYGPLDWRNAFSHALYWSSWGDHITRGRAGATRADVVNTARFVFFSLQSLVMRGKMVLFPNFAEPFSSYVELTPDTRYIPYLHATYMKLGKDHFGDAPNFKEGTPGPNYMTGFVSSMQNWIELLYLEGGEENLRRAEDYYVWLRENNPNPDGTPQDQYLKTVDEFVMGDIISQLQTYKASNGIIRRFITRSLKEVCLGEKRASLADLRRARQCYDVYMEDMRVDINDRRKMQPFRIIYRDEIESFLKEPGVGPLFKVRLWKELALEQRQMTYDHVLPYLEKLCESQVPPWDATKAFDEPPGMEEFRKQEIEYRGAPRTEGVEQGERPQ
jgi:hypothetical protein